MACVISAPSSSSGKTLISILISSWARKKKLQLQSFKVGPDYLDPQLLSAITKRPCRNLDLILCGSSWVQESFHGFGWDSDLSIIEGVMGLFDGIGSSSKGSTAALAKELNLPVVLVLDARGQAASIGALIEGFKNKDPEISLAGVVINRVNSDRHQNLLEEVIHSMGINVLGCIPNDPLLEIECSHLGIAPQHEIRDLESRISLWSKFAEKNLNIESFLPLLKPPSFQRNPIEKIIEFNKINFPKKELPIAVAEDNSFHFRYPETKELLEKLNMPVLKWSPLNNEEIPPEARGIILPGGFPEEYAQQLSASKRSIRSIRSKYKKIPIYAECGGMIFLGNELTNSNGSTYPMVKLLPFRSRKGSLKVGYRSLKAINNSLIVSKGDNLMGHEYHRWELKNQSPEIKTELKSTWEINGWGINSKKEGLCNKSIHASWIHLHWPSNVKLTKQWVSSVSNFKPPD